MLPSTLTKLLLGEILKAKRKQGMVITGSKIPNCPLVLRQHDEIKTPIIGTLKKYGEVWQYH